MAAYYVAKYPEHIGALVLVGASAIRPRRLIKRVVFGATAKAGKVLLSLPLLNKYYASARRLFLKSIRAHDAIDVSGLKREIFKKVMRQDLSQLLPKITIPTLVIWGSSDSMTPLRQGKKIAKLILGAKLVIVKGGRHGLHLTHAKAIIGEVYDFVHQKSNSK